MEIQQQRNVQFQALIFEVNEEDGYLSVLGLRENRRLSPGTFH